MPSDERERRAAKAEVQRLNNPPPPSPEKTPVSFSCRPSSSKEDPTSSKESFNFQSTSPKKRVRHVPRKKSNEILDFFWRCRSWAQYGPWLQIVPEGVGCHIPTPTFIRGVGFLYILFCEVVRWKWLSINCSCVFGTFKVWWYLKVMVLELVNCLMFWKD